jgi:TonB family protein
MPELSGRTASNSRPSKRFAPASFAASLALHGAAFGAAIAAEYFLRLQFLPTAGERSLVLAESLAVTASAGAPQQTVVLTLELPPATTTPTAEQPRESGPSPIEPATSTDEVATLEPEPSELAPPTEAEPIMLVMPSEVWQDERRFVSVPTETTVQDRAIDPAEALSSLAAEPPTEEPREAMPADRPTETESATKPPQDSPTTAARSRKAAVSADLRVASVDAPPARIRFVGRPCRYPEVAIASGWEGEVMLSIRLDDAGMVVSVELHKSSGVEVFDAEAIATARTWRAVSDFDNGRLWATHVLKPIIFRIPR